MQESKLYFNLIMEMIDKLNNSIEDKGSFMQDSELQDATLMRLQVIGENVKKIALDIKKKNKHIKWKKFEKLRNIISHKYASVDYELVWDFIENNLEELKIGIVSIK